MKLTITKIEARQARIKISNWGLKAPSQFFELSNEEIARNFNGVGADETARPLRKALSFVFDFAFPAVVIHDNIWTYVKEWGLTLEDFYKSNEDLKNNARICLPHEYSWYNPFYLWQYKNCWSAQQACDIFGKSAWES